MIFDQMGFQDKLPVNSSNTLSSRSNVFIKYIKPKKSEIINQAQLSKRSLKRKQLVNHNQDLGKPIEIKPKGNISAICYAKDTDEFLFASSFDKHVYLYNAYNTSLINKFETGTPLLDICSYGCKAFTAGADGNIRVHEIDYNATSYYGQHEDKITSIGLTGDNKLLVSSGLDGYIKVWDSRMRDDPASSKDVKRQIFCMDVKDNYIVVGCNERVIQIFDVRYMNDALYKIKSDAKSETKSLKLTKKNDGIIVGTIDGTMYTKIFNITRNKGTTHLVDAHSNYKQSKRLGVSINTMALLKDSSIYFTGGADGIIKCWDQDKRTPIGSLPTYPGAISSFALNNANDVLAVASSSTFGQLNSRRPTDQIYFRDLKKDNHYISMDYYLFA